MAKMRSPQHGARPTSRKERVLETLVTSRDAKRLRRWLSRAVALVLALGWAGHTGCLGGAARLCVTDADCANNAPNLYCFRGVCDTRACEPGVQRACYDGTAATRAKGTCRDGLATCLQSGNWSTICAGQRLPRGEICDREDNDCNGKVDDGIDCRCKPVGEKRNCYNGPKELQGKASCRGGIQYCEPDNLWGRCLDQVLPRVEVCDQVDNDCNGQVDELLDCRCRPGAERECYQGDDGTAGQGLCQKGIQFCRSDFVWGPCLRQVLPQVEQCGNRLDDDCDGVIDETCVCLPGQRRTCYDGSAETQGKGPCRGGEQLCLGTGTWGPCVGQVTPQQERCANRLDDDCDGIVDEGCTCPVPGATEPCYDGPAESAGKGACKRGSRECLQGGVWGACAGQVLPATERCSDGVDNDCDGATDENDPACTCAAGRANCKGACADLQNDTAHCGACDNACPKDQLCFQGTCRSDCPASLSNCQGRCVDLQASANSCGACGNQCAPGQLCVQGNCRCPSGGTLCGNACVDLTADPKHCGGCDAACEAQEACQDGVCQQCPDGIKTCGEGCCPSPRTCCGGGPQGDICVDLTANPKHCGGCGRTCQNDEVCCQENCVKLLNNPKHCGACSKACAADESCCGSVCVKLNTDASHCGTCANACAGGQSCCAGKCVDLQSDAAHCGSCAYDCKQKENKNACTNGACNQCASSLCGTTCCSTANTCCNNSCTDTQIDPNNCGTCGNACAASEACCKGTCIDILSDAKNCGRCALSCDDSQRSACCKGSCVPSNDPSCTP